MEEKQPTIEQKVMKDIHSGKVKLRSRYIFLAEKLGLGSAVILSLLLGALAFNVLFFYLRATDNLIYLSFGRAGLFAFLESFPYLLVIGCIILVFLAGILVKKSNLSYKRPFAYSAVLLVAIIIAGGAALTYTGIAEGLEKKGCRQGNGDRIIKPFFRNCFYSRKYGVAGKILGFEESAIILQTPEGLRRVLVKHNPSLDVLRPGQFVVVVGELNDETFQAQEVRIIDEGRIPMIRRGIMHRFPPQPAENL